jgi:prepilin-type N-terminal cleavage/methylation domain-containing protein/prepilin-type processing-associated H-X9-DG protein
MNRAERQSHGFTLIEILIVIAIISLLAAILFPVFGRARESARRASCASNMRQLGMGFAQYIQDYDERLPRAGFFGDWTTGAEWVPGSANDTVQVNDWPGATLTGVMAMPESGAIYPYVKNAQVFVCPSTEYGRQKRLSYSMNCALSFASDAAIPEPSSIVLLVDEDVNLNDSYFSVRNCSSDGLTYSHLEGGNLLYADGHVKWTAVDKNKAMFGQTPTSREVTTGSPRFLDDAYGLGACYVAAGTC